MSLDRIKSGIRDCVPDAYYPNGKKSERMFYKICNMFDISS
jgi:hypothetical protein